MQLYVVRRLLQSAAAAVEKRVDAEERVSVAKWSMVDGVRWWKMSGSVQWQTAAGLVGLATVVRLCYRATASLTLDCKHKQHVSK